MKVYLILLVLVAAWNCGNTASVGSIILEDLPKPFLNISVQHVPVADEDMKLCTDDFHGTFIIGVTPLTKQCGVATCKEDGKLIVDVCPALSVAPGYIIVPEDLSKPHPECCEKAVKAPSV